MLIAFFFSANDVYCCGRAGLTQMWRLFWAKLAVALAAIKRPWEDGRWRDCDLVTEICFRLQETTGPAEMRLPPIQTARGNRVP